MKVLSCYSIKGGVGKTASSVNIAYWAAKSGIPTLLIDLDPQGASSFYYRVKPSRKNLAKKFFESEDALAKQIKASDYDNLDVIPAHLSFRNFDSFLSNITKSKKRLEKALRPFGKEYPLIILDCPPTLSHLSEAIFNASDLILVPVIPTTLSERTFEQLYSFFKTNDYSRKRLLPFFSMVQSQKSLHKKTMESMRSQYKNFMKASIPFSVDIEHMGENRAPVDAYAKHRPANKAYQVLWKELSPQLRLKLKR